MSKRTIFTSIVILLFLIVLGTFLYRLYSMNKSEALTNATMYSWLKTALPSKQDRVADTYSYTAAYTYWDGVSWHISGQHEVQDGWSYDWKKAKAYRKYKWTDDWAHTDTYVASVYKAIPQYKEHDYTQAEINAAENTYESGIKTTYANKVSSTLSSNTTGRTTIANNLGTAANNFNTMTKYMQTFAAIDPDTMSNAVKNYQKMLSDNYDTINANYKSLYKSNPPLSDEIMQLFTNLETANSNLQNKAINNTNTQQSYNDINAMTNNIDAIISTIGTKTSTINTYCNNIINTINSANATYNSGLTSLEAYSSGLIANQAAENYTIITAIAAVAPSQTDIMTAAKLQSGSVNASKYLQKANQSAVDASNNYSLQLVATKQNNITGSQTYQTAVHDAYLSTIKYAGLIQNIYNDASGVVASILQKAYAKDHQAEDDVASVRIALVQARTATADALVSYNLAKLSNDDAHNYLLQAKDDATWSANTVAQYPNTNKLGSDTAKMVLTAFNKTNQYSSQSDTAFNNVAQQYNLAVNYLSKIEGVNITPGLAQSSANFAIQAALDASTNSINTFAATKNTTDEATRTHNYRLTVEKIFDEISGVTDILKKISENSAKITAQISNVTDKNKQINSTIVDCTLAKSNGVQIQKNSQLEYDNAKNDVSTANSVNTDIKNISGQFTDETSQKVKSDIQNYQKIADQMYNDIVNSDISKIVANITDIGSELDKYNALFDSLPLNVSNKDDGSAGIEKYISSQVTSAQKKANEIVNANDSNIQSKISEIKEISSVVLQKVTDIDEIVKTVTSSLADIQDNLNTFTISNNNLNKKLNEIKTSRKTITDKIAVLNSYKDASNKILSDDKTLMYNKKMAQLTELIKYIYTTSTTNNASIAELSDKSSTIVSTINNCNTVYANMIAYQNDAKAKSKNSDINKNNAYYYKTIITNITNQFTSDTTLTAKNSIQAYEIKSTQLYNDIVNNDINNITTNSNLIDSIIADTQSIINNFSNNLPNDEYKSAQGIQQKIATILSDVTAKGNGVAQDNITKTMSDVTDLSKQADTYVKTIIDNLNSVKNKLTTIQDYESKINTGFSNINKCHDVINVSNNATNDKMNTIVNYKDVVEKIFSDDKSAKANQDAQSQIDAKAYADAQALRTQTDYNSNVDLQNAAILNQQTDANAVNARNKMDIALSNNQTITSPPNGNAISSKFGTQNKDINETYFLDWGRYSSYY